MAVDVDGTLDANPRQFQSLLTAVMAAGHTITILTGTGGGAVATQSDLDQKVGYLNSLGCGQCWSNIVIIAHDSPGQLADQKAQWCVDNGVDVMIDNEVANAKASCAAGVPLVLVPWGSKVKDGQ